jgi:diguanylate cyclase (GGDEF)-like protein
VLSPAAGFDAASTALDTASAYWRAERERVSAAMRARISRVADTLIVLSAIVFGVLVTALGMYAKRNRQLAGMSHEFEYAALHDAMTGLPNRRKLFAALGETAARSHGVPSPGKIAVLYMDLDGFKRVNDTFGHRIGDEFLIAVSKRFRESVRTGDVVARIGGDEFAVLVRTFASDAELSTIAQRLIACVSQTDEQMGLGVVRASIGIASFPDRVADYWRLVAAADETMYQVKRNGKNGFAFARPRSEGGRRHQAAACCNARLASCAPPASFISFSSPPSASTRSASIRASSPAISTTSDSKRSSSFCAVGSAASLSTSSAATRLMASEGVSTNDTRSFHVIARRMHCLPASMWRRTSSASRACPT